MEIIIGGRRTGKTHQAVELFLKDKDGILIVHNRIRKDDIVEHYKLDAETAKRVQVWGSSTWRGRLHAPNLYIDQIDHILGAIFAPATIKTVTLDTVQVTYLRESGHQPSWEEVQDGQGS